MKNNTLSSKALFVVCSLLITSSAWSMGKKAPTTEEPTPTPPPVSSSDAAPLWEAKVSGSKAWTSHLNSSLDTLGGDMLDVIPADYATFCPKYKSLSYGQRKQVWMYLISYMTKFESDFNTNLKYTESFDDSTGNNVISRGLLQISIESGNAYGCGLKSTSDLHDPYKNLDCGVRILNRWLGRDGRIAGKVSGAWKGGARYWSVLRSTNSPYNSIVSGVSKISLCKK